MIHRFYHKLATSVDVFTKGRTMRMLIGFLGVMILLAAAARGDGPATRPIGPDSPVDEVLDALQRRGNIKDFTCTVRLSSIDPTLGESPADAPVDVGRVVFQKKAGGDARIRVTFIQTIEGNKAIEKNHDYVLDDGKLVGRDYNRKSEETHQISPKGQKMNLLKLGEGPFPLPIGQDKNAVKEIFTVTKIAAAKDDPVGSAHIQLAPKPDTDFARKFQTIDVWVDPKNDMPVRIDTVSANGEKKKITELQDVKIDNGVGDADFVMPVIDDKEWDHTGD